MKRTTIGLALVGAAAAAAVALLGNDSSRARGGGGASDGSCTPTSSSSLLLLYHDDVHDIEGAERLLRDDFCPLFWLTDELLQHIVSFLQPGPDTSELFSVCVRFKDLMENDDTWHKLHARWFGSWKPEHTTWRMRCCYATLQLNTLLGRELFELWGSIQLGRAFADLDSAASSSSSSLALSSPLSSPTISSPPASLSTTASSTTTTSTTTSPISSSAWWLRRRLAAPARSTRSRSFTTNSSSTPWVSSSSSIAGLSNNRYTTMWRSIANSLPSWRSLWSYVASDLDLDFEDELDTYHDDADEGGSGSSGGASGSSASSYMSEPVDYGDPRYPASHSHKSDSGASELEWRVKRQWFWAARNGHEAMVHSLVSSHTVLDLDMREDETCMSALHVAAQYGQISVARELVALYHQRSLSVDPSCFGTTPLHLAAEKGFPELVSLLLEYKADLTRSRYDGASALYLAAQHGCAGVARVLLSFKADPNSHFVDGSTPLYAACKAGNSRVVELLLAHRADPNRNRELGHTPLYIACLNGRSETVNVLLTSSALSNACLDFAPLVAAARSYGQDQVLEILEAHRKRKPAAAVAATTTTVQQQQQS